MREEDHRGPFEARGLDPDYAETMGARFRSMMFQFDYREPDGSLLYRKFRKQNKQFHRDPSGTRSLLWGIDKVPLFEYPSSASLIVTEGEFDRLAFGQVLRNDPDYYVVSVPDGANRSTPSEGEIRISEDKGFSYLWEDQKLNPRIAQFRRIILATDADEKGMILRDELALRIGPERCWFLPFPPSEKDGNAVLMRWGERGIRRLVAAARPIRPGMQQNLADVPSPPSMAAYSTCFGFLDRHLMIVRPELLLITGAPGSGKGVFARCLAAHLAENHGWRTSFLSPEDPAYRIRRDLMRFAQRNMSKDWDREKRISAAYDWIRQHFFYSAIPEDEPVSIETVLAEMEAAVLQHDCQVFVLDPWNEISYKPGGEGETKDIERLLVQLKQKMRRLNLLLIIVAHPRKPREGEKINLYTVNASANWFNKCDHGIVLERWEPGSPKVEITIEKCKDHETMGVPGTVFARLDPMRFVYEADARPTDEEWEERKQRRKRPQVDAAMDAMRANMKVMISEPDGDIHGVDGRVRPASGPDWKEIP